MFSTSRMEIKLRMEILKYIFIKFSYLYIYIVHCDSSKSMGFCFCFCFFGLFVCFRVSRNQ